jgi:hypothetical protein
LIVGFFDTSVKIVEYELESTVKFINEFLLTISRVFRDEAKILLTIELNCSIKITDLINILGRVESLILILLHLNELLEGHLFIETNRI